MKKILTLILLITACSEDEPTISKVPDHLFSRHITTFYQEAELRGLNLPTVTPEVRFTSNSEFERQCNDSRVNSTSYREGDKYIIEITDRYATIENDSRFELPIIRELAHLLLERPYETDPFVDRGAEPSMVNPMSPCASETLDYNDLRKEAFDYLFQQ